MVGGIIGIMAYFLDFRRLYAIAAIMGFGFFIAESAHVVFEQPVYADFVFALAGTVILVNGIRILLNFLGRYPKGE